MLTAVPAQPPELLPVIYRDADLIAINKPAGLLVHRSPIDRHETRFAIQLLRDQIGQRVYPLHRLDKPTSGLLLFALSPEIASQVSATWAAQVTKHYLAVVRGVAPAEETIDHPLNHQADKLADQHRLVFPAAQAAQTSIKRLASTTLPYAVDKYPESRYSLVECQPHTGRKHQIRRHLKHISHPIIGDAKHGKGRHNRFFAETLQAPGLLLAATQLSLTHPVTGTTLTLNAPVTGAVANILRRFDWLQYLPSEWQPAHAS